MITAPGAQNIVAPDIEGVGKTETVVISDKTEQPVEEVTLTLYCPAANTVKLLAVCPETTDQVFEPIAAVYQI